jgi:hypothetical protein
LVIGKLLLWPVARVMWSFSVVVSQRRSTRTLAGRRLVSWFVAVAMRTVTWRRGLLRVVSAF